MKEYKILEANALINKDQLNEMAKDGWELVTIVPFDVQYFIYFEREITSSTSWEDEAYSNLRRQALAETP